MNFGFCLDWSLLRSVMYRLSKFGNMFWKWFSYSWLGKFQIYVFLYSKAMIQFVLHYVEVELYYSYATGLHVNQICYVKHIPSVGGILARRVIGWSKEDICSSCLTICNCSCWKSMKSFDLIALHPWTVEWLKLISKSFGQYILDHVMEEIFTA